MNKEPKFKRGDRVQIMKKVANVSEIGGIQISSFMREIANKQACVIEVIEYTTGFYYLLSNNYVLPKQALKKV